jgi:hypothetical protein
MWVCRDGNAAGLGRWQGNGWGWQMGLGRRRGRGALGEESRDRWADLCGVGRGEDCGPRSRISRGGAMIGQASWVGLWESAGEAAKVGRGQLDRPLR